MKIKDWISEGIIASEELKGREDLQPFLLSIKKSLLDESFSQKQVSIILQDFLKQLNSSGYLKKIEKDDEAIKDISINIQGSDVVSFTVTSDEDPKDKKVFVIKVPVGSESSVPAEQKTRPNIPASRIDTSVHGTGYQYGLAKKPGQY